MNQSITRLTLDVSVQEKQASISVRQYDTQRRLVFSLVDRGLPYTFEKGVYAAISVNTSSETAVFGGCVIEDGAVHYDVPASMTLEPGEYACDLILYASDHKVLTASSFDLIVFYSNASAYAEDAVQSDDFHAMVEATAEARDAAQLARDAAQDASVVADLANDAREDAEAAAGRAFAISETLEDKLAAGEFQGEKGDTGEQGPQGIQGEKGDKGDKGDPGESGILIAEITSPDEITADSPDGLYIQEGGSGGSSGGTTIHYYDSLEAAEAANLPEGSFVAVPSEGTPSDSVTVIDFDEYGLTNLILTEYMGGGCENKFIEIDLDAFWKSIPQNGNLKVMFTAEGVAFYYTPTYVSINTTLGAPYRIMLDIRLDLGEVSYKFEVVLEVGSVGDNKIYDLILTVTPKA